MKNLIIILGGMLITFTACNKRNTSEASCYSSSFETHIQNGTFDQIPAAMQSIVAAIDTNQSDSVQIATIVDWLNCQPAVIAVEKICVSCIETLPTQSEIRFKVQHNGQDTNLVLDILMSKPLRAQHIH